MLKMQLVLAEVTQMKGKCINAITASIILGISLAEVAHGQEMLRCDVLLAEEAVKRL